MSTQLWSRTDFIWCDSGQTGLGWSLHPSGWSRFPAVWPEMSDLLSPLLRFFFWKVGVG